MTTTTGFYQRSMFPEQKKNRTIQPPKPQEIKDYLDRYIIGQDEAKKTLAVAVYNHYKRIQLNSKMQSAAAPIGKSNVMLIGESGCGKTYMVQTIARMLDVPCYIQDCTKITASGYVGSDVEDCLCGLLRSCDYDVESARHGIIMLDEVDKIRKAEAGVSITRDVSGECVQQSLLKIVDGDRVGVPPMGGRKHPEQKLIYLDTSDILFIASGAFVGLDQIVSKRLGTGPGCIGFDKTATGCSDGNEGSPLQYVIPEDLRSFGMIPEFVGRFPVVANVNPLDTDALVRILTEPENAITKQYQQLLAMDHTKLEFEADALKTIAELSSSMGTGARGLRGILERLMRDIMFDAPSMRNTRGTGKTVTITADMVNSCGRLMRKVV